MARTKVALVGGVCVVAACAGGVAVFRRAGSVVIAEKPAGLIRVERTTLPIALRGTGTVESVKNQDLVCPVEGQNTIRTIVPEGTMVTKDAVICELDTSTISKELQQSMLESNKADADALWAQDELVIQESKNASALEAAVVELRLADLSLREYVEGIFPQKLEEATKDLEVAKRALTRKQQELLQTRALHTRGFASASDIDKDEQELAEREIAVSKKETALRVLKDFTHEKEIAEKEDKVSQARNKVERIRSENASQLAQKKADLATKKQSAFLNRSQLDHWQKQMASASIKAPIDGIVVYGSSVSRYIREQPIGPGARVYEQQLIARIPDTSAMKAMFPVAEGQIFKLQDAQQKKYRARVEIAGMNRTIHGTVGRVSVLPDNQQMWFDPDRKQYPVEIQLDETPPGLKPGMSAQITVELRTLTDVLAVPAAAIYSVGQQSYVFVDSPGGAKPVPVKLGESNDTLVELASGIEPGVSLWVLGPSQGERLLERAGVKPPAAPKPTELPVPPVAPASAAQPAAAPVAG